jgi:glyoxylase-like metal-dependent hydrolase (beta-lactamase superfamily II)
MHVAELPQLDLGTIRLRWLNGGTFRMDGAAVFGQVPRPIWTTLMAPDVNNSVDLTARVLLVETAHDVGLIDAGLPHTSTLTERAPLAVEIASSVREDLRTLEIDPQDIRWVVLTHLHPDHAGGAIVDQKPLFPNARHLVQRREVEAMQDPDYPRRQGFERQPYEVLMAAGLVAWVDEAATVAAGVRVVRTGGHTPGHQAVIFEGHRGSAVCLGDLLPTRHHIDPVCVAAVDDYPLDSIAVKRAEFSRAGQIGAWLTVAHDPEVLALRCGPDGTIADELRASGGGQR